MGETAHGIIHRRWPASNDQQPKVHGEGGAVLIERLAIKWTERWQRLIFLTIARCELCRRVNPWKGFIQSTRFSRINWEAYRSRAGGQSLGSESTNTNLVFEKQPSAPTNEKVSNDLVKQIRKLRWIGMDSEAESCKSRSVTCKLLRIVWGAAPETD